MSRKKSGKGMSKAERDAFNLELVKKLQQKGNSMQSDPGDGSRLARALSP